jgi:hypothetical protein
MIRKIEADAYERGKADAIARIMAAASGVTSPPHVEQPSATEPVDKEDGVRKRAPRGSVGRLVQRVITAAADQGAIGADFMEARNGDLEMMIQESSIRSELRRGREAGEYIEKEGRWFPGLFA